MNESNNKSLDNLKYEECEEKKENRDYEREQKKQEEQKAKFVVAKDNENYDACEKESNTIS